MSEAALAATIDGILRREGAWSDDPLDRGGPTRHGISLRYARRVGLDRDGDGDVDADDVRRVTLDDARGLYREDFYRQPGIDGLPEEIGPAMLDAAVNMGPPRAVMLLQSILNRAGFGPLSVDGVIGPRTRTAAATAMRRMGPYLVNALVDERIGWYRGLVERDPTQRRFLAGWIARAQEFRQEV
ncbi:MAG: glycoside hydrolase family 108 protein [Alphaproteobacteria bacterium]